MYVQLHDIMQKEFPSLKPAATFNLDIKLTHFEN